HLPRRNLRAGSVRGARTRFRLRGRTDQRARIRQWRGLLHVGWRRCAGICPADQGGHGGHQRAHSGAHGMALVRRLEALAVRRPPCLRRRRRAFLYALQERHATLAGQHRQGRRIHHARRKVITAAARARRARPCACRARKQGRACVGARPRSRPPAHRCGATVIPYCPTRKSSAESLYLDFFHAFASPTNDHSSMRIGIGGFQHETNTFAPSRATWEEFADKGGGWPKLVSGPTMFDAVAGANIPVAGFIDAMREHTLLPTTWAAASPSGPVTRDAYERIGSLILDGLRQAMPL